MILLNTAWNLLSIFNITLSPIFPIYGFIVKVSTISNPIFIIVNYQHNIRNLYYFRGKNKQWSDLKLSNHDTQLIISSILCIFNNQNFLKRLNLLIFCQKERKKREEKSERFWRLLQRKMYNNKLATGNSREIIEKYL